MTVKNNVKNNVKNIVNVTNVPLENDPSKMYTVVMYAKESGSSRRYVKFIFRVLPTKNLDMIGAEDVDLNIINMRNFLFAAQQGVTIHQLKLSVSDADYMDFYKEFVKRANGKDKNTRFMLDGTARMVRDRIPGKTKDEYYLSFSAWVPDASIKKLEEAYMKVIALIEGGSFPYVLNPLSREKVLQVLAVESRYFTSETSGMTSENIENMERVLRQADEERKQKIILEQEMKKHQKKKK